VLWSQTKCTPTAKDNVYARTNYNEKRIHTDKNNRNGDLQRERHPTWKKPQHHKHQLKDLKKTYDYDKVESLGI
jgi:hypothetical protein